MRARFHSPAFSLLSDFDRVGESADVPDHDAQLKSAFGEGYRKGHAEGRAEAEADAEYLLAEEATRHNEDLDAERQTWQRDCADVLIARLESVAKSIELGIEEHVATLLRPWLIDRLRNRALEDLEKAISRSLVEGAKVHIEAPADVVRHLQEHLSSAHYQIGYSESANADIRASIDDTKIELNISAWIADLEAIA